MSSLSSSFQFNRTVLAICAGTLVLFSCQKDPNSNVDCTGLTPTYSSDIKAILDESCAKSGCHNSGSQQAGIDLSTYTGAKNVSSQDRFLGAIRHSKGFEPMPKNGSKLSSEKIDLITCWVQNGAVE